MIRLFVGLELPEDLRARLAALSGGVPGANWVPPENMHVTLRFIGEVDEGVAADVHHALSGVRAPAFDCELVGIGTFGQGRHPHALWVGVERGPALLHLHDKVESALVRAGLPPDSRKFVPHVTLARLKEAPGARLPHFVARNGTFRSGPVRCSRFALFSSRLGRGGAAYTVEAEYALD